MEHSHLFLSYSRKQFYIAGRLAQTLNEQGLTTWFDAQKIRPGSDWQGSIDDGLATCQALVVLTSRAAYRSGPVRYEVDAARKAGKPIYLVVIEDSPFGASLPGTAKVIDCRSDFATGVRHLVTALKTGQQPAKPSGRRSLLSPRIPFGKVKYLQLLALNLAFLFGAISATGKVTEYPIPSLASNVLLASEQLIETADHILWFVDPHGGIIGYITAAHTINLAPLPAGSVPRHLVADAAGGLWILDTGRAAVGHLSASGRVTSYPLDGLLGPQSSLTVGPDGSVWFTLENQVGQIPPGGRMKFYDIPTLNAGLGSIVVGADGHVWFAENAGLIGELTP